MKVAKRHKWLLSFIMIASMIWSVPVSATQAEPETPQLEDVDMSKGLTYIYDEENDEQIIGLNLNGNPAVICESDNSTEETALFSIYFDKNMNGKVDAGDELAKIDGKSDFSSNMVVYGLYKCKTDKPISIALESGKVGRMVGVYQGQVSLTGTDAPAVRAMVSGGSVSDFKLVAESSVTSDGTNATLVDIDISGGTITSFNGTLFSTLDAGAATNTAIDFDVTGNPVFSGELRVAAGIDDSHFLDVPYSVNGDIKIDMLFDALPESGNSINSAHLINGDIAVTGDVVIVFDKARINSLYGLNYSSVAGDYTFDMKDTCDVTSGIYAAFNSKVQGNVDMDMCGKKESTCGYIYGMYGQYKNETELLGGDFVFDYNGGGTNNLNIIYGYSSNSKQEVKGSITVKVHAGTIKNMYAVQYVVACKTVDVDINNCNLTGYIYAVYYADVTGAVAVDVLDTTNTAQDNAYIYGTCYVNTPSNVIVNVKGGYFKGIQGVHGSSDKITIGGNVDVTVENVNKDVTVSSGSYSYMVTGVTVEGNITVDVEDSAFYALYGTGNLIAKKDIIVEMQNLNVYNEVYGAYPTSVDGDVTATLSNTSAKSLYGVYIYNGDCGGSVSSTITDSEVSRYLYGFSGSSGYSVKGDMTILMTNNTCDEGYVYGAANGIYLGKTNITIKGGTFGAESLSGNFFGVSFAETKGDTTITLEDIKVFGYVTPYSGKGVDSADVDVYMNNFEMNSGNYSSVSLTNNTVVNQKVTTIIDDKSIIPDNIYINPASGSTGEGVLTYKGDIYVGGAMVFDKDVTYNNIHFMAGSFVVEQGATVTVEEGIYLEGGSILLEGTLQGELFGQKNDDGKFNYTSFYMNGGTLGADLDSIYGVYYPFAVTYRENGGVVSQTSSTHLSKHNARPDIRFAPFGNTIAYTIVPNEGYSLTSVTVKNDKMDAPADAAVDGNVYSFVMEDSPTTLDVTFTGNPLMLGKTVADPVVKLNQEYSQESPVYDLTTIAISNDGKVGEVTYKIDPVADLPEGLIVKDNKIFGVPSVAYEDGKKTIIHVTGKNGAKADVTLNIVVTAGESTQTSQDGRITIDEENAKLYLNGNSVVFELQNEYTAIFMDDNKDGIADYATPAYVGDLTNYTVYGICNADAKDKLRLTMNDGTVGTIIGAHNGTLVEGNNTLQLMINGGSIGKLVGLSDSTTEGTVKAVIDPTANATYTTTTGTCSQGGLYYNNKGVAYFYGTYVLEESLTVTTAYFNKDLYIEEGVTLDVTNTLIRLSGSTTYLRGNLRALKDTNPYGLIYMQGGTLPEDCTWKYVYYPVEVSTTLKNTSLSFNSGVIPVVEDGKTIYYAHAGTSIPVAVTDAAGYDAFVRVDDGEYIAVSAGKATYSMPYKVVSLEVLYVPKQISVEKQFVEPVAIVGETYTQDAPLYDLRTLIINNDTSSAYGEPVQYALKSGSVLPEGLSYENKKIVGTPTKTNGEGETVTFLITGMNGTIAEVDITIKVEAEDYKKVNINDDVTADSSNVYLNGKSIVIVSDPSNSNKASIYPDYNMDKIADNNIPLKISGNSSYSLSSVRIYGYTDTEKPFDGDISITVKGGFIHSIYGVYSSTTTSRATVNGDVKIYIENGNFRNKSGAVYGAYNAVTNNVVVEVTGGDHYYADFGGACNSIIKGDVDFTFGENVSVTAKSSSSYHAYMYGAQTSTVEGDVNLTIGCNKNGFVSSTSYAKFYGVLSSDVAGNVNCRYEGMWNPGTSYLVYDSDVGKNLDVDWAGTNTTYQYFTYLATIKGDILFDADENLAVTSSTCYLLCSSTAASMYVNVPESCTGSLSVNPYKETTDKVTKELFINNKGYVRVGGNYTLKEDLSAKTVTVLEDSAFTIAEDVTLTLTECSSSYIYGTLTNKGTIDSASYFYVNNRMINEGVWNEKDFVNISGILENYGEMSVREEVTISNSAARLINGENATFEFAYHMKNNSSGRIINYGTFNQTCARTTTNYNRLGIVYTTKPLNLYEDISKYKNSYCTLYYAVTPKYPANCVKDVTITGTEAGTSGVEGDDVQYVKAGSTFTVNLGEQLLDTVVLQNVTYGPEATIASEQQGGAWQGTGLYEPFEVSVNYGAKETVEKIELEKTADTIENTAEKTLLVVGATYSYDEPLYDLTTIGISKDTEDEGEVLYSVDVESQLPAGLLLKNGRIYGTIKKACADKQDITFVVVGKNQTSAFFTLTLGEIKKKVPEWSIPTGLSTTVGKTFKDVVIGYSMYGSYSWEDNTKTVGTNVTTLENVELYFTPNDTDNYDWETVAKNVGATYADGKLTCNVSVEVKAGIPTYTLPENLKATFGQTFGDIPIDAGDNDGTFTWEYDDDRKVGNVGTRYYYVTYTPNDTKNYQTVKNISVPLVIEKATPVFENTLTTVTYGCGITLADVVLPTVSGGTYRWITTGNTIPVNGVKYQAGYKPDDINNYDWSSVEGWNSAWGCVVFPVAVYLEHDYVEEWTYDEEYHWHQCTKSCESRDDKEEHTWTPGEVIVESTLTTTGSRKYTCKCGAEKVVETPVIPHTEHTYSETWNYNDNCHWKECTFEGCEHETEPVAHTWDEGTVLVQPTETTTGSIKYTCPCGKTKVEELPVLTHTNHVYGDEWKYDDAYHWKLCTFDDCKEITEKVAHEWDEGVVLVEPTETSEGSAEYTCICGKKKVETLDKLPHTKHVYSVVWKYDDEYHWKACTFEGCEEITAKATHEWDAGVVLVQPTETSEGSKKYTCKCGATKTEVMEKIEHTKHTYGDTWEYDEESHWQVCTFGECKEQSESEAHTWDEEEIVTSPTETTTGLRKYTCKCGMTKTEAIPMLPHSEHIYTDEWKYNSKMHWKECADSECNATTDLAEHSWGEGKVEKEATELEAGIRVYTCECGATKEEVIEKLEHTNHVYENMYGYDEEYHWKKCTFEGCDEQSDTLEEHSWDEGNVLVEPTQTTEGIVEYSCECGASRIERLPIQPHMNHVYDDTWKYNENCHWQVCIFDGCEHATDAQAHVWDKGAIEVAATENAKGIMKYTCKCGAIKREDIPPLEHTKHVYKTSWDYDADEHWHACENEDCDEMTDVGEHVFGEAKIVVPATEDEEGTKQYTCKTCGYSYTESYDVEDNEKDGPLEEDEEFEDEENDATYMVTTVSSEVEFVASDDGKTTVEIPSTVTYDGVTYKVTSIAPGAFKNSKIKKIVIGSNIKKIGSKAFYGCKKLTTVKMGKNVETIGNSAFQNCTALKKIEIPSKVKKIGSKAFYGCKALTNITIKTTKLNTSKVGKNAFTKAGSKNYKKLKVKVPKKKLKAYKTMLKKRGLSSKAKVTK